MPKPKPGDRFEHPQGLTKGIVETVTDTEVVIVLTPWIGEPWRLTVPLAAWDQFIEGAKSVDTGP